MSSSNPVAIVTGARQLTPMLTAPAMLMLMSKRVAVRPRNGRCTNASRRCDLLDGQCDRAGSGICRARPPIARRRVGDGPCQAMPCGLAMSMRQPFSASCRSTLVAVPVTSTGAPSGAVSRRT